MVEERKVIRIRNTWEAARKDILRSLGDTDKVPIRTDGVQGTLNWRTGYRVSCIVRAKIG